MERTNTYRIAKLVKIIIPVILVIVAGCAPILSNRSLREVDQSLTFREVLKNPNACKGKLIVVGGRILSLAKRDDELWVEVLQQPLDGRYIPEITDSSDGRFILVLKGITNPDTYAPGRRITIAGEVTGEIVMPINKMSYTYPTMTPREHILILPENYYEMSPRLHNNSATRVMK